MAAEPAGPEHDLDAEETGALAEELGPAT